MNLLTGDLPYQFEIDDKLYDIDTDYKNCLIIIQAWEDNDLTGEEKIYITLDRLFEEIPQNLEVAIKKSMLFLNCGEEDEQKQTDKQKRVYSFDKDSKYIFSAVDRATDGKLSNNEQLHWWLFCVAFMEVSETSFFSKMIDLRTRKAKGKLSKEEKQFWSQNKDLLELEPNQGEVATDEEVENMKKFDEIMKKKKLLKGK